MNESFFEVADPLDHTTFLSVCDDVLRDSLLLFAPFGLPRQLRQALGSEKEFIRQYGPRFRFVLEAVSDATYKERGVSESEVAVTLHKYTEEEQSPETIDYLARMADSLRMLYTPPRVLQLPEQAPSSVGDLVSIASGLLRNGAVYAPEPPAFQGRGRRGEGEGERAGEAGGELPKQVESRIVCEARFVSSGYYFAQQQQQRCGTAVATASGESSGALEDGGRTANAAMAAQQQQGATVAAATVAPGPEVDREKAQRAKVASCLLALQSTREELESFSAELEQAHMQALAEAFAARYKSSARPASPGYSGNTCARSPSPQSRDDDEDPTSRLNSQTAALAELAAVPFVENELFVLIRGLEQQLLGERRRGSREGLAEKSPVGTDGGGNTTDADRVDKDRSAGVAALVGVDGGQTLCGKPEACLDSLLTSRAFRVLADQSMEKGLDETAAAYFEQAKSVIEDMLEEEGGLLPRPRRYLAELRAGLAKCQMRRGDSEAASVEADRALEEHPACGEAFLVRGQCRQMAGNNEGALSDLVNAFVLRGSALNPGGDSGDGGGGGGGSGGGVEAQAVEEVSRENCRERAGDVFSRRPAPNALPADWVVRSFLASYNTEALYAEHDSIAANPRDPLDDICGGDEVDSSPQEDDGVRPGGEGGHEERHRVTAAASFWEGLSLAREGKYTESIDRFSSAAAAATTLDTTTTTATTTGSDTTGALTEGARIQSLALEYYGSFLYLLGDMDAALEHLSRAGEVDPNNAKSWVKRGSVLNDLGRREEAIECFESAQAIDPRDSDLFLHRGQGHLLANDYRKAAADLRRSVELCPTMPISRAAWGVALFKLATADELPSSSSLSKCLRVLEDARERFPDSPDVLFFLAEVLISMGDFGKGLDYLRQAASLDPECPIPYVNAARGYLGMNDTKAARRHLEKASELDPTYPGTCLDLGQLLMQEGSPAEALSMYARGVEKARFPSELHDAMSCLEVAEAHLSAQRLLDTTS